MQTQEIFSYWKKKKEKIRQNNMEYILGSHSAVLKNIRYKTISYSLLYRKNMVFLIPNHHFFRQINVLIQNGEFSVKLM